MASSSASVHPLVDFLDLAYRRGVSSAARCVSLHSASSRAALSAQSVSAARHSELLAPLTWLWFRREWLLSGCRILPLLAAHMQSALVQSASSAAAPANPALASPLFRTESAPRQAMHAHTADCYDAVTARLTASTGSLLRRLHIYYALYTLHGCQATVERYPAPLTRHHWRTLLADLRTLQQLPIAEPYATLRHCLEQQSVERAYTPPPLTPQLAHSLACLTQLRAVCVRVCLFGCAVCLFGVRATQAEQWLVPASFSVVVPLTPRRPV